MKKSLLALAVLGAFAGAAQAQSAVTIYGVIDGGVRTTNADTKGRNWTMSGAGTNTQNRLGFKGVEDLGGGMNAHFALEGGWDSGSGAGDANGLFARTALVGLGGSWGSLDFGRQYSVNFKTIGAYDPFSYRYTGIVPLATQGGFGGNPNSGVDAPLAGGLTRLSNDLQYTGTFGPVTVRAEHSFGEQAGAFSNGSTNAVGVTFADGPISVGGAYTSRKADVTKATAAINTIISGGLVTTGTGFQSGKNWTVGGAYTLAPFRVAAGYADSKQDSGLTLLGSPEGREKTWWLGGSYALTPAAELTAGYYHVKSSLGAVGEVKHKLLMVGGNYALSKRTSLYADIDNHRYDGSDQKNFTGVSVGVTHAF